MSVWPIGPPAGGERVKDWRLSGVSASRDWTGRLEQSLYLSSDSSARRKGRTV
jgi:hypothetical protein